MFGGPTTGMHTRGDRGIRNSGQLPRVMYKDEFAADTAMQMEPDNVWALRAAEPALQARDTSSCAPCTKPASCTPTT